MKGVTIKTDKGWVVRSFTISDSPPFFDSIDYPVRYRMWPFLKEGEDIEFIWDVELTPVGADWYAAIKDL